MKNTLVLVSIIISVVIGYTMTDAANIYYAPSLNDIPFHHVDEADIVIDTIPLENKYGDHTQNKRTSPYDLNPPKTIDYDVDYDPITGNYIITERIGEEYIGAPTYMTFSEYLDYKAKMQEKEYFDNLAGISTRNFGASFDDPLEGYVNKSSLVDRLFGGNKVNIRPEGNIDLKLGFNYQKLNNPNLTQRNQRPFVPDFKVDINMSINGQIGDKLSLNTNFNTRSQFDFDRQIKLKFDSEQFSEDDIIRKIEAGDVSLPLRSNLIQGSQSLFGIKVESQWGHLNLTAIASKQKSQKKQLRIENGAQVQYYELRADEYDENRHFFLSQYNREAYEPALRNLPQVNSLMKITRLEVWVTNIRDQTQGLRDVVAIADLGEASVFTSDNGEQFQATGAIPRSISNDALPSNEANTLFEQIVADPMATNISTALTRLQGRYGLAPGKDFEIKRAKKLRASDYTFHPELGFISVNVPLRPDEVLAVAYEYDYNGETYSVGQLDSDNQTDSVSTEVLFVKLLKSTQSTVGTPLWDLMMKNVYALGAYQANREDFFLDVYYDDAGNGLKRFLPEPGKLGKPLLQVFNLDNLNVQGDPQPDGRFDYVPGITILPRSGKMIFPVLEPFGKSLKEEIGEDLFETYGYSELYDSTLTIAREYQEKNRFLIKGKYQSSVSSEISLGTFNLPQGSVTVRAGGRVLQENIDYEVDYQIGLVRIINESVLAGGSPIDVSYEDNALFSFQEKQMFGLRALYEFSKSLSVGATYMHLWEKPYTQKVNIGEDPINNRIIGLDLLYEDKAPWLTKAVDLIPGIDTKEESRISFYTEGALIKPGHSKAINVDSDEEDGAVFVDDFEGATGEITLISPLDRWVLASIPQAKKDGGFEFPESELNNDLRSGMNRALINWYQLDITADLRPKTAYDRPVSQTEIFKRRTPTPGLNAFRPLDIVYYPNRRGPYNFDPPKGSEYSAGLNQDGTLRKPENRWGGIMRDLTTNDFQQTNIEYIEFWMMNPFIGTDPLRPGSEGEIVFNLGNVSEDILKDGKSSFENGLPGPGETVPLDTSVYGVSAIETPYVYAFSNDNETRELQDVGYDGLDDETELTFFSDYITKIKTQTTPDGQPMSTDFINEVQADPANDNFINWDDAAYASTDDILTTFTSYNGSHGNSPVTNQNDRYPKFFTIKPSTEDPNRDYTSDQIENYFEYRIPIERDEANMRRLKKNEYIIDESVVSQDVIWYRFKVPVQQFNGKVGNIQDFRSIRFLRMYFTEFTQPTVFRFATFNLVRNQWRRWTRNNLLTERGPIVGPPGDDVIFDVNEVSIEKNSDKTPFNYVLPPGIKREQNFQATSTTQFFNEQSLALNICNLDDGDARAIYKNTQRDLRVYDKLKMFVHAEATDKRELEDGEVSLFLRFGSDYSNNYYEYELPLVNSDRDEGAADPNNVWRPENGLDIALKEFIDAKIERNNSGFPLNELYEIEDPNYPGRMMRIKGNPNLGYVKGFMIGVRNPDDGSGKICAEIWVNELRVAGLEERGGMAALARLDMKLADFGNFALSGNYSTIGWGGLEQKLDERAKEEIFEYDASLNLELSKFLPEDAGVSLPMYAQYSQSIKTPQYDPYDLDIELDEKLNSANAQEKDSIKTQALDITTVKSLNFTNVKKDFKGEGKPMPWDVSNLTATYGYTESDHRDPLIELDNTKNHHGVLTYRYNYEPLYIEPFKELLSGTKYLKFIQELHLNPLPNSFGHSSTVDRTLNVRRYRFSNPEFSTWTDRQFTWNRNYNLRWDLTRSLNFDYNATNYAVIDELDDSGESIYGPETQSREEYLWSNVKEFGRTKDYNHSITASWNVPLKNFPFLEFINLRAQTRIDYSWNSAAVNVDTLGHTIQNGQTHSVNTTLSFDRLYNKSAYLKEINSSGDRRRSRRRTPAGEEGETKRNVSTLEKVLIRPLLLIKTARANYSLKYNSVIPGYLEHTSVFGLNSAFNAPGVKYILGFQPDDEYLFDAAENKGWFTASRYLSQDLIRGKSESYGGELNLEPLPDLKIDINLDRSYSLTSAYLFKTDVPGLNPYTGYEDADYNLNLRNAFGSYSTTYLAINTLFKDKLSDVAALFDTYESYRPVISQRLYPGGEPNPDAPGYQEGYGKKQPQVLIPAFIAAYTDKDPSQVNLDIFSQMPLPNWTLNYNGLSKVGFFKDIFSNVTIRHAYSSTMTVSSFQSNGKYIEDDPRSDENKNEDQNFYSEFYFPELRITESLSPLVGISIKTKNDMQFDFDYNKSRDLSLNFTNSFLHETRREEISVNFGYLIKDLQIKFLSFELDDLVAGRGSSTKKNQGAQRGGNQRGQDMNIALTIGYSDDITLTHQLDIDKKPTPERGMKTLRINPTVAYDMNKYMNLQAYFDYQYSEPATSQSYPITRMSGGLRLRFKLQ